MAERTLLESALDCEDALSGLQRFRDALPRHATNITAVLSELFAVSAALREIHNAEHSRTYGPSFYQIHDDLALVRKSLSFTTQDIFDMFSRSRQLLEHTAWEDLENYFVRQEGSGLQERLEYYRDFLDAQNDILGGHEVSDLGRIRRHVNRVLAAQQRSRGSSTPRPRRRSSRGPRPKPPSNSTIPSEDLRWERPPNIYAPDPPSAGRPPSPLVSPLYSTFSSGSSQTMSSHTSHSSDPYFSTQPGLPLHWAEDVFDGSYSTTRYKLECQSIEESTCTGELALDALEAIASTGFQRAVQLPFDENRLCVRLYYRPGDYRAIILIMAHDAYGQPLYYSERLAKLKIVREGSVLILCRVRYGSEKHIIWARLNFILHERMVLFYNTFIAMKHQDQGGIAHGILIENYSLENCDNGERVIFTGEIRHHDMRHLLRLVRDSASKVVRLEASPLRGQKKTVPIWTAFVTRYAYDPDWPEYKANGIVALAKLKTSVFIHGYEPPVDRRGNAILPFASDRDARKFMEEWAGLCRRYGR